ncbi:MAG: holo-ACP synthase [Gallionella sp.]
MIFGIGTDIVEYARIEKIYTQYGDRFAERILSKLELDEFKTHHNQARFLAKRFAAKEAFAKATGSGIRGLVSLKRITITHDDLGKPGFLWDDLLHEHLTQLGITNHHLSISDERNLIVAFVVLEGI